MTIDVEITIPDATGIIEKFTLFFTNNNLNLAGLRSEIIVETDSADILKAHFTLNTKSGCDLAVLESELAGLCTILNAEYHFMVDNKVTTV